MAATAFRSKYGAGRVRFKEKHLLNVLQKRKLPKLEEMFPFKEGDKVIVTKGVAEDVGKMGFVRKVDYHSIRVLIEGVGLRKVRAPDGEVYDRQRMINMRNIRFVDPKTGLPTDFKWMWVTHPDGRNEKERIAKSGSIIVKPVSGEEMAETRGDPLKDTPKTVMEALATDEEAEIRRHAEKQCALLEEEHHKKLREDWRRAKEQHEQELQAWRQFKFEVYTRALAILKERDGVTLPLPPLFRTWAPIFSHAVPKDRHTARTAPDPEPPSPNLSDVAQEYFWSFDGPPNERDRRATARRKEAAGPRRAEVLRQAR